MTYKELSTLTEGKSFPLAAENEDGERVIIEVGANEGGRFFRVTTAQNNDWYRIETIWEDGFREEAYSK